ncbi:hypothetical protein GA0061083_1518 [Pseudarthrobacter enclensis]|uniref:Mucin-associated surface protein n=1 Tax=Pseudarthrobacter enclensis TaxID=993070 RepID=A0A0V8ISA9_9MICC|nr:hypothetical protein AS031_06025 [Pseudarthrobacter enclensis]SCB91779.1 hypothetical protein GA0061083_1518 [Pseudarthrobacter enclensis]
MARRLAAGVAALLAVTVAVIFAVSATGPRSDAETSTLRGLQIRVLSISQAAAENRLDGALAALQALQDDLDGAARDGRISAPKARGIESALAAVRADITDRLESQAAAAGTAAGTAPVAATTDTPAAQAPAPAPAADVPAVQPVPPAAPDPAPASGAGQPGVPGPAKAPPGKAKGHNRP